MMWYWGQGMGGWWMLLGAVFMIVFWAVVIVLVVWGIRKVTHSGDSASGRRSPLDILKERYARGEINKEQFEQMKKDLS